MSDKLIKIYFTGASGYIGGAILHELIDSIEPGYKFEFTALARNEHKAVALEKAVLRPNFHTVIGNLGDQELTNKMVNNHDVIIDTADVDNVENAIALSKALKAKSKTASKPTILIHTSGTSVIGVMSTATNPGPVNKVYSDLENNFELNRLPSQQPHRPVDEIIQEIQAQVKNVRTVVVCPPTIFGISKGYIHRDSIQVPSLIRATLKKKQAFTVFSGDNTWNLVHIDDLAKLYHILLLKLLAGEDIPTGKKGYYFAENGFFAWKEVAQRIAEVLHKHNLLPNADVTSIEPQEAANLLNDPFAPMLWGTTSRCKAELGRKLGWIPAHGKKDFLNSIEDELKYRSLHKPL
ncbi:NAD dependent epimerase/dehydratase family protein [Schizosaccharomyces japonicus yFS275]|uniref:NAD dependent epimerase/dehydratase family protein n=1 Tax=Schizosaccharomyces japonicus (strain yFS275 / FY16936) TaxID=402676 RepID=B6K2Y6_SCHJY|nr:NAD dependent epimerase/dehydratase family protein [Schizosaccharomyces japonicus yFS275]EEB07843.1 NAD dependent epimerase/dehydratase family protein [Schizosaccharomyces japonicus yFS275]